MLESFLLEGNQAIDLNNSNSIHFGGLSVTDPCLSWNQTEILLLELADKWIKGSPEPMAFG